MSLRPLAPSVRARSISALNRSASIAPKAAAAPTVTAAPKTCVPRRSRSDARPAERRRGFASQPASAKIASAPSRSTSARIRRGAASPAPARARKARPSRAATSPISSGAHSAANAFSPARKTPNVPPRDASKRMSASISPSGRRPCASRRKLNFAGRPRRRSSSLSRRLQRGEARSEIERSFRVDVVQRACDDVAQALDLGIGVDERSRLEARMQVGQRSLGQAAQVKIGARREVDRAVAAAHGGVRQRGGLIERQSPSRRPHPREQSVSGLHRPEGAWTPALAIGRRRPAQRNRAHGAPSSTEARMRALELRRESQKPRLAASSNTPAIWEAA